MFSIYNHPVSKQARPA